MAITTKIICDLCPKEIKLPNEGVYLPYKSKVFLACEKRPDEPILEGELEEGNHFCMDCFLTAVGYSLKNSTKNAAEQIVKYQTENPVQAKQAVLFDVNRKRKIAPYKKGLAETLALILSELNSENSYSTRQWFERCAMLERQNSQKLGTEPRDWNSGSITGAIVKMIKNGHMEKTGDAMYKKKAA